jgi:predicted MPP superfamily phosphohydrolase
LLAHEPDIAEFSSDKFDIQFSGHTHGGQFVVPFVGPIVRPSMGKKFSLELYKIGSMLLYVSAGLGISPLPKPLIRFNCPHEISVFLIQHSITI